MAYAGNLPGEVREIQLDGTKGWTAEKDAFVAAEGSVRFDIKWAGFSVGRKGGEGMTLAVLEATGRSYSNRSRS